VHPAERLSQILAAIVQFAKRTPAFRMSVRHKKQKKEPHLQDVSKMQEFPLKRESAKLCSTISARLSLGQRQ